MVILGACPRPGDLLLATVVARVAMAVRRLILAISPSSQVIRPEMGQAQTSVAPPVPNGRGRPFLVVAPSKPTPAPRPVRLLPATVMASSAVPPEPRPAPGSAVVRLFGTAIPVRLAGRPAVPRSSSLARSPLGGGFPRPLRPVAVREPRRSAIFPVYVGRPITAGEAAVLQVGPPVAIRVAPSRVAAVQAPAMPVLSPSTVSPGVTAVGCILAAPCAPPAPREGARLPVNEAPAALAGAAIRVAPSKVEPTPSQVLLPEAPAVPLILDGHRPNESIRVEELEEKAQKDQPPLVDDVLVRKK